ncbi:MAG: winged helix-turn-helix transcriptional regulator [Thermoproteales archaeon]|nr:winged helix-turn-helix transcriptional regulator [Thermoproteales archaeon]
MVKIPVPVRMEEAKALADEVRLFILDLLSKNPRSVQEIVEELKKRGMYKNINTVRYHIRLLKEAGLIELVKTEEVKGGVLKYYASKRKVYAFEVPKDVEIMLEPLVNDMYMYLKPMILELLDKHRQLILESARKLKPCPYCITEHFAEYILVEAMRKASGKVFHDPEVEEKLSTFKVKGEEGD